VDAGAIAMPATTPATGPREIKATSKKPAGGDAQPSLLARIGRGLKSLVTRAPRSQH
jgi:hypothetical protein